MPTLTINSVIPGNSSVLGHAWIEIKGSSGANRSYGFYPQSNSLSTPGEVRSSDSTNHPLPNNSSGPIEITESQATAIRDFADRSQSAYYQVTGAPIDSNIYPYGAYNCATWVVAAVEKAGLSIKAPLPVWIPWWLPSAARPSTHSIWDGGDPFTGLPWPGTDPLTNTNYRNALAPPRPRDPLAIDLDGDGIETVGVVSGSPILFDHNADGIRTGTGWVTAHDAWLVLDRDGNGLIDTGRELFGVDTLLSGTPGVDAVYASTGFEALGTLNSNGDGVFDASDAAFGSVRLWQDLNQDGISQSTELFTLAQKNIASIGLVPTTSTVNLGNGNTVTGQAVVTRTNGSTTQIDSVAVGADSTAGNLNLANNPFYREFSTSIPLTAAALALRLTSRSLSIQ